MEGHEERGGGGGDQVNTARGAAGGTHCRITGEGDVCAVMPVLVLWEGTENRSICCVHEKQSVLGIVFIIEYWITDPKYFYWKGARTYLDQGGITGECGQGCGAGLTYLLGMRSGR